MVKYIKTCTFTLLFNIRGRVSHPGGPSSVGRVGVEMVADVTASSYPDVYVQIEVLRRRFVYQVLRQRLEHHHGGLGEDREGKHTIDTIRTIVGHFI